MQLTRVAGEINIEDKVMGVDYCDYWSVCMGRCHCQGRCTDIV